ncbi:tetratricopeptide repeat protein [Myxococcota bacterium]|nr:tetratricopeptide repeat protein [Myxococcota bacterium]
MSSSLFNGFLNWDDIHLLLNNTAIHDFDVAGILTQYTLGIYHPVTLFSLAIEHAGFGLDPFIYHLDNLLLHAGNSVLVAVFLRRTLRDTGWLSFAVGALFAVHPLHVEPVAWVSQRKELLSCLFVLSGLIAYIDWIDQRRVRNYLASVVLLALALLSKPMAMTTPVLMLLIDHYRGRKFTAKRGIEKLPFFAMAIATGWISLRTQAPDLIEPFQIHQMDLFDRILVAGEALLFYAAKTVLPDKLSAYYDIESARLETYQAILGALTLAVCVGGALLNSGRAKVTRFGLVFFLITIGPILKIVPFGGDSLFNDRYMYVPSIGLLTSLLVTLGAVLERFQPPRRLSLALGCGLIAILSLQSFDRARDWRNSQTLWESVLVVYPSTPRALMLLARSLHDEDRDLDRARELLLRATSIRPRMPLAHYNLGLVEQRQGNPEAAERSFARSLALNPRNPAAQMGVGIFHLGQGNTARALEHLEAATILDPRSGVAEHNLAVARIANGESEKARASLERVLEISPGFGPSYLSLAELLLELGEPEEAKRVLTRARQLGVNPMDTPRGYAPSQP